MNTSFDLTDAIPTPLPRRHGLIFMDNYPPAASTSSALLNAVLWRNLAVVGTVWPMVDMTLSVADDGVGKCGRRGF